MNNLKKYVNKYFPINDITNSIKEKYQNNLDIDGNNFNIININEKLFIDNINSSYNNRKNIDLDNYDKLED